MWGKATATIHAPSVIVLSYLWLFDSFEKKKIHQEESGNLVRDVTYLPNSRISTSAIGKKFPSTNRVFFSTNAWGKLDIDGGKCLVIASKPRDVSPEERKTVAGVYGNFIEAKSFTVIRIQEVAPTVCCVIYAGKTDVGGQIPRSLLELKISYQLDLLTKVYEKFERRGKDVDAEVGCFDGVLV